MADLAGGILQLTRQGPGVLRDLVRSGPEVLVPLPLIRQYGLVEGAAVTGPVRSGRRGPELAGVDTICGLSREQFAARTPFERLVAVDPDQRFNLAASGEPAMRIVDLVAPIGKGTRGLIVAPPKAGKTTMLEQIAHGVRASDPETRIVVLLVDERPEEATYFRRTVSAEVMATTSDRPTQEHIALVELMLAHIRLELECGHDVVVLMDSLTRLVRAFNLQSGGRSRTLSGGLEAAATEVPRRFFGLARNVEQGGSVTLVATVLVDTGSRMDQVIFEEFKSTGNSEIVLDRALAQERIFPAIDVHASGTRKEELLYGPADRRGLAMLRRAMAEHRRPREAMLALLHALDQYPTNEALLQAAGRG